jgi:hypothetical protein
MIEEFETGTVTLFADVSDSSDPDGVNYNITATFVDGAGFFHSTTNELKFGYENNTNNNIGISTDPTLTLVAK